MYEFTVGGAWFQWSALDRTSKQLAAISLVAASIAAVPIALYFCEVGYDLGHSVGRSMAGATSPARPYAHSEWLAPQPWMAWLTVVGGVISALFWWRFSPRQDEMFNRVQNWALGMGGAWTMAATYLWLGLWAADVAPAPNVLAIALGFYLALCAFWFMAVKRWA